MPRRPIDDAAKPFARRLEAYAAWEDPIDRLEASLDALDALEDLAAQARQIRAGAVLDLRNPPERGAKSATWPRIVELSGRDVTPQAVQQWAEQYRAVPA